MNKHYGKEPILRLILVFSLVFVFFSCATAVDYRSSSTSGISKPSDCPLDVYLPEVPISRPTTIIGSVVIKDSGFTTDCDWDTVLGQAKERACDEGADALQIYEINEPDLWSTCYRIEAHFHVYSDQPVQQQAPVAQTSSTTEPVSPGGLKPPVLESQAVQKQIASIRITQVSVNPSQIQAGSTADLEVTYTVTDPGTTSGSLPVAFSYRIYQGTSLLYTSETYLLKRGNGTPAKSVAPVQALRQKGSYRIQATVKYKDLVAEKGAEFIIE